MGVRVEPVRFSNRGRFLGLRHAEVVDLPRIVVAGQTNHCHTVPRGSDVKPSRCPGAARKGIFAEILRPEVAA